VRNSRLIGRIVAFAAVTVAVAAVATLLLNSSGGGHTYKAIFQNGSQLVKGDLVQVSGTSIGTISDISLTSDGQAQITMNISGPFTPLREGTRAVIREASLSGIANRYIDLTLPPDSAPRIPDNGVIPADATTSEVDLDQIFNVFGPKQRQALSPLIQGFATTYAGQGQNANPGFLYLNPALASSVRLFSALDSDKPLLRQFINANASFVTDVAARQNDLAGLIDHLATTTTAIGQQRTALADAVATLPSFMREANTTFVNLRNTLNDLTPLVDESKPVAKKLRPFFAQLRPFAAEARPTIHDLSILVKNNTPNSDLTALTYSSIPVRNAAIGPVSANGASRQGAFPESVSALAGSTPEAAFVRPYSVDLTGWFSDFSTPGIYDALGAASRAAPYVNLFAAVSGQLVPVPPALKGQAFNAQVALHQNDRCPGTAERNAFPAPAGFECNPAQQPPGP
jgi:phospholipid/cholesterol/gamma-HCH transport system substrate-binding protein